jgi:hypothetical protein
MKVFSGDRDGECARRGFGFEAVARGVFESRGYATKAPTEEEAIKGHVDFWVKDKNNEWRSVDAKAMKKMSRSDNGTQDEWTFVEWLNNAGMPGWLARGAEFMAFEREEHVFLVKRSRLHDWAKERVDFNALCMRSSEAKYKVYSRFGREDLTSLIRLDDLPAKYRLMWPKTP